MHVLEQVAYIQVKCLTMVNLWDARQLHGLLEDGSVCPVQFPQIIHEAPHTYGLHRLCRKDSRNVSK